MVVCTMQHGMSPFSLHSDRVSFRLSRTTLEARSSFLFATRYFRASRRWRCASPLSRLRNETLRCAAQFGAGRDQIFAEFSDGQAPRFTEVVNGVFGEPELIRDGGRADQ